MKHVQLIYIVAGVMALSAPQLTRGDDAKPSRRPTPEQREKFQNLSPEEREAKIKEFREKHAGDAANFEKRRDDAIKDLGLNPDELKKLPESERRAKIKEAAEKKLVELQKKKTDGSITDAEKETLQRLEQRKKFMEDHPNGFKRPGKPGAEKPSDK
jgi:hypothetical protein